MRSPRCLLQGQCRQVSLPCRGRLNASFVLAIEGSLKRSTWITSFDSEEAPTLKLQMADPITFKQADDKSSPQHKLLGRVAKAAGLSIASLGLALSANAATVKLGADGGGLVFDPATVTISAGDTVEWVNNVGFPHNVVFDEDEIPVSLQHFKLLPASCSRVFLVSQK